MKYSLQTDSGPKSFSFTVPTTSTAKKEDKTKDLVGEGELESGELKDDEEDEGEQEEDEEEEVDTEDDDNLENDFNVEDNDPIPEEVLYFLFF